MINWYLERENGQRKSFTRWQIAHPTRIMTRHGEDNFRFSVLRPSAVFRAWETIRIFRGDQLWFRGQIVSIDHKISADSEEYIYLVSGPWWSLQHLIYQQLWNQSMGEISENVYQSHVLINQTISGAPLALGEQLADVLEYAQSAGLDFTFELDDFSQVLPLEEHRDLSCGEVIHRLLRWVPDAVIFFDFCQDPVKLCIRRAKNLQQKSLTEDDRRHLKQFFLSPRYDLQLAGVVIKYEKIHQIEGKFWKSLEIDRFPEGVSDRLPQVLVLTVELEGLRQTVVTQELVTEPIEPEKVGWWRGVLPALGVLDENDLRILSWERVTDLPRRVTKGGVASWMEMRVEPEVIRAKIAYRRDDLVVTEQDIVVKFLATDGETGIYSKGLQTAVGENVPNGVARTIYESREGLLLGGKIVFGGEACFDCWALDLVLVEMTEDGLCQGIIDEIRYDFDGSELTLILGHGDRLEYPLAVLNRRRDVPRSTRLRSQGSPAVLEEPLTFSQENVHLAPPTCRALRLGSGNNSSGAILLDADQIQRPGHVVQLREEDVCDSGILKKRLVVASQPYVIDSDENSAQEVPHGAD